MSMPPLSKNLYRGGDDEKISTLDKKAQNPATFCSGVFLCLKIKKSLRKGFLII
jgi:hypothetical protein